jgi:hypothetical protein
MNYLTNYYKNLSEQLQERITLLESQIKYKKLLVEEEDAPVADQGNSAPTQGNQDQPGPAIQETEDPYKWDVKDAKNYKTYDEWLRKHSKPDPKNYKDGENDFWYHSDLSKWNEMNNKAQKYYSIHKSPEQIQKTRERFYKELKGWGTGPFVRHFWTGRPIQPSDWDMEELKRIWDSNTQ